MGGNTGTEAGIAMGGVGVVEYQSIDIIEQRSRVHGRAGWLVGWLLGCCWLLLAASLVPTQTNPCPLNGTAGTPDTMPLSY